MRIRLGLRDVTLLCAATIVSGSVAAGTQIGQVQYYWASEDGGYSVFLVSLSGSKANGPGCDSTRRYSASLDTPFGREVAAAVRQAYEIKTSLTMVGKNTCNLWGDSEDLRWFGANR
jgi:hypothetical protein